MEESEIPVPLIQLNDFWTRLVAVAPSTGKVLPTGEILACEQWGGGGKEKRKREPVGMAKVFSFHMPVIYVIFKSTIRVVSTTTTDYFE